MKKATQRKLRDVTARVKDLKSSYISFIKNDDPKERMIPRVTALVIREGRWLTKLVRVLYRQSKKIYNPTEAEKSALQDAETFFETLYALHEEDVARNLFVYRMDPDFILHMEKICVACHKLDGLVRASLAAHIRSLDDATAEEDQEEIDAAMMG